MALNLKQGEYLGKITRSFENRSLKLSTTCYEPYSRIERHYHENNYISILIKGSYTEKSIFNNGIVNAGEIVFRPNLYTHENIFGEEGGKCFNIELKSEWQKEMNSNFSLPDRFVHDKPGRFPCLHKLLVDFQKGKNELFLTEFIGEWLLQIDKNPSCNKTDKVCVQKAIQIIENNPDCFHALRLLAKMVLVHPVYLARAFKEKTGCTIGEYQLKMKMAHAIPLLLSTSFSISDISYRCGFYDDAHFIRTFRSFYEIAPHQFRLTVKS